MLHFYLNLSLTWVAFCALESEVGANRGSWGEGVWCTPFHRLLEPGFVFARPLSENGSEVDASVFCHYSIAECRMGAVLQYGATVCVTNHVLFTWCEVHTSVEDKGL